MDLSFHAAVADGYKSGTQRAKNLSEPWVVHNCYCPSCGFAAMTPTPANSKVVDFICEECGENFELKAQARAPGRKVVDGAYRTMLDRLRSNTNPNLLLLHYDPHALRVRNLVLEPKYFFVPEMIIPKRPLGPHARRAGWVGCNIVLTDVPDMGKIHLVRNDIVLPKGDVVSRWRQMRFLAEQRNMQARGWLLALLRCIERIGRREFSLDEIYRFEPELQATYPNNHNIKAKLRQRLQVLRDKNYLVFLGNGQYRLANIEDNGRCNGVVPESL